jgi:hypothetical protein
MRGQDRSENVRIGGVRIVEFCHKKNNYNINVNIEFIIKIYLRFNEININ